MDRINEHVYTDTCLDTYIHTYVPYTSYKLTLQKIGIYIDTLKLKMKCA